MYFFLTYKKGRGGYTSVQRLTSNFRYWQIAYLSEAPQVGERKLQTLTSHDSTTLGDSFSKP